MNRKFIKLSLASLFATMSFLVGCGPQDLNDADYLAQTADSDVIENKMDKDDSGAQEQAPDAAQPAQGQEQGQGPQGQGPGQGPAQGPQGAGAPAPAAGGAEGCPVGGNCPSGNCETPGDPDTMRTVQLPDQISTQPTKIIPTNEKQLATDIVDYRTTRHIWQPSERHHTTHKHRNLIRRHFTKIVYHPTHRRINRVVRTASATDQVMPTEEVVAPLIDHGCEEPRVEPVVTPRPVIFRPVPVPVLAHPGRYLPY